MPRFWSASARPRSSLTSAPREGQICDLVRIGDRLAGAAAGGGKIWQQIGARERADRAEQLFEIDLVAVGAPAGLGDERARLQPFEQPHDLGA